MKAPFRNYPDESSTSPCGGESIRRRFTAFKTDPAAL
jgi:hypothetical protein